MDLQNARPAAAYGRPMAKPPVQLALDDQSLLGARNIFSGLIGCELTRTPKGASASSMAFMTAPGAPAVPASPAPFANQHQAAPGALHMTDDDVWHLCP